MNFSSSLTCLACFIVFGVFHYYIQLVQCHSFIVGNDGALEAVGYDVTARYNNISVKKNIVFDSQTTAHMIFNSPMTKIFIPADVANSFSLGKNDQNRLLTFGTIKGQEVLDVNASLGVLGDIDLFNSPTNIYIPNNESNSLTMRAYSSSKASSSEILSIDTSMSTPHITMHGSFSTKRGFQSVAEVYVATLQGFTIPSRSDVVTIESANRLYSVVLPHLHVHIGHKVRFHNPKLNEFVIRVLLGSENNYTINGNSGKFMNVTGDTAIVDCFLVSLPGQWVCVRTNNAGRQDPVDHLRVSNSLIFKYKLNDTFHQKIEMPSSPSINRNIFLPDASGTIITTGNLEDINGQVQSLSVKDELSINGDVTLGDSREDDILLGGIVQNFNSPIVKGIAIYNDFVKVTVMEHTLIKDMKVLIYSVESISLHNTNTINNIYMVDRVTENTFCLKTQDGFHFLNINDFSTSESVRFEGGKILPLHMTDFRTNSFEYVESNIIEVNITKSNINVEEDMDLNCVHFKSVTIPQISSLVFHVIETNYVWSEDISSYLVSLHFGGS